MKYRTEYDAKTKKLRIFINERPANKYDYDWVFHDYRRWSVSVTNIGPESAGVIKFARPCTLASLKSELDALDATRYKELSFTATAN